MNYFVIWDKLMTKFLKEIPSTAIDIHSFQRVELAHADRFSTYNEAAKISQLSESLKIRLIREVDKLTPLGENCWIFIKSSDKNLYRSKQQAPLLNSACYYTKKFTRIYPDDIFVKVIEIVKPKELKGFEALKDIAEHPVEMDADITKAINDNFFELIDTEPKEIPPALQEILDNPALAIEKPEQIYLVKYENGNIYYCDIYKDSRFESKLFRKLNHGSDENKYFKFQDIKILKTFINEKDAEKYYTNILRKTYDKFSGRIVYAPHKTEWEELLDIWQEQLRSGK